MVDMAQLYGLWPFWSNEGRRRRSPPGYLGEREVAQVAGQPAGIAGEARRPQAKDDADASRASLDRGKGHLAMKGDRVLAQGEAAGKRLDRVDAPVLLDADDAVPLIARDADQA